MGEAVDVAERYYSELAKNDGSAVAATLADDASVHVPGATLTGPQQFGGWMQAFFDAFPDISHAHTPLVESGDTVTTQVTVRGTQTQPLVSPQGTIPPTGKSIDLAARNELRVAGGKIVELTIDFDQAGFMNQLGLGG